MTLSRQVRLSHLIEEQGAAIGRFDQADLALLGIGEGAALMAEEFGFEQLRGHGGAVDLDERPGRPRAPDMAGAGYEFLAGAGLTGDEHRWQGIGPFDSSNAPHPLHQRLHGV